MSYLLHLGLAVFFLQDLLFSVTSFSCISYLSVQFSIWYHFLHLKHLLYKVFSCGSASHEFFHLFLWKGLFLVFILKRILLLVSSPAYRLAACFFFPVTLKMLFLTSLVSLESLKSVATVPLLTTWFYFSVFKIFWLLLAFRNLIVMFFTWFSCCLFCLVGHWASCLCGFIIFIRFIWFLAIISLNNLSLL